jgi:hypothetical protein
MMHALTFLPGGPQDKSGDATRRRWLRQFCGELPDGAINGAVFFQTRAVLGSGVQRPRAAGEECDGKDECYFFHSLTEGAGVSALEHKHIHALAKRTGRSGRC